MIPATIVTFRPDPAWPAQLDAVLSEHPRVVVVDNSDAADARKFVAVTVAARPGVSLRHLPENPGIGTALNLAFATLAAEGHACAVAYDQDSTPVPGFALALSAAAESHPDAAVIGANWTDPRRPGQAARFLRAGPPFGLGFRRVPALHDLIDILCVITSGSLFDLAVWTELGGFDEGLFLDLVDTDYCLRARRAGHNVAVASGAELLHRRGDKRPVRRLGHTFHPAHTPLFRLHCLTRNRILLYRRHRLRPVAWANYEFAYAAKLVIDALLFENNKTARIGAMLRGVRAGAQGKTGPIRPT